MPENIEQLLQNLKSLRLREDAIIQELERELRKLSTEEDSKATKPKKSDPKDFKVGDKVLIKNRATSSIFNRKASLADRKATITRIRYNDRGQPEKIFITTDAGLATHRLPKYIEKQRK